MKQDQNLHHITVNINRILTDCKSIKKSIFSPEPQIYKKLKIKTLPSTKSQLNKSFDFDTCVRVINTRVRSLQSAKVSPSPSFRQKEGQKKCISSFKIDQSLYENYQTAQSNNRIKTQTKAVKTSEFPRLLSKYQRAYSPKNASSSQKYSLKQRKSNKQKYGLSEQQYLTYHQMIDRRKKAQQLRRMFIINKVVRQNLIREKKILQQRKKQRKFNNLNLKQITLTKSFSQVS